MTPNFASFIHAARSASAGFSAAAARAVAVRSSARTQVARARWFIAPDCARYDPPHEVHRARGVLAPARRGPVSRAVDESAVDRARNRGRGGAGAADAVVAGREVRAVRALEPVVALRQGDQ